MASCADCKMGLYTGREILCQLEQNPVGCSFYTTRIMTPWEMKDMGRRGKKVEEVPSGDSWGDLDDAKGGGLGFLVLRVGEQVQVDILTKPIWYDDFEGNRMQFPGYLVKVTGEHFDAKDISKILEDDWMKLQQSLYNELVDLFRTGKRAFVITRKGDWDWDVEVL